MTIALAVLACIFAALWLRARRMANGWRHAADAWQASSDLWEKLAGDWRDVADDERAKAERSADLAEFWKSIALYPLQPSSLTGRIQ